MKAGNWDSRAVGRYPFSFLWEWLQSRMEAVENLLLSSAELASRLQLCTIVISIQRPYWGFEKTLWRYLPAPVDDGTGCRDANNRCPEQRVGYWMHMRYLLLRPDISGSQKRPWRHQWMFWAADCWFSLVSLIKMGLNSPVTLLFSFFSNAAFSRLLAAMAWVAS